MTDIVDEVAGELRSEMPATLEFYKQRQANVGRPVPPPQARGGKLVADNISVWEDEVSFIKDFIDITLDRALSRMAGNFGFSQVIDVTVNRNDISMGEVRVHAFRVTPGQETGQYFPGIPLRMKAEPKPGHTFVRWEGDVSGTDESISPTFSTDSTITAVFAQNCQQLAVTGTLAISEFFYNPPGLTEDAEFVEFLNLTSGMLDLSGVRFTAGLDYTFPPGTMLAGNERFVIRPTDYAGNLDNDGETLTYVDAGGQVIESITYNDGNPCPEAADGDGHSLVRIDPSVSLSTPSPRAWRLSVQVGGNAGTEDSAVLSDSSSAGLLAYAFGGMELN